MATLPTFDELYAAGQAEVQSRNAALTDWTEGSVLDAVVGGGAVLADEVIRVLVDLFAAQFVDTAEGDDLEALAADRFGLTRNAAAAAVGELTFTRGTAGAYTIPAGTRVRATVNGVSVTVETDADAEMGVTSVDVAATCQATGPGGNLAAETLTELVDAVAEDSALTVTNAARFAGGADEEGDAAFRDRIRRYFSTLRKGTRGALEAGALNVSGVSYATVDESFIAPEDGGYVAVYVGDPDGAGNETLATLVEAELEDWRAAGVWVRVLPAEREEVELAVTLYVDRGADVTTLASSIRSAILAYTDALAPGGTLYRSQVVHAALGVSSAVRAAEVTAPAADLEPTEPQNALRVVTGDLALTFVEV